LRDSPAARVHSPNAERPGDRRNRDSGPRRSPSGRRPPRRGAVDCGAAAAAGGGPREGRKARLLRPRKSDRRARRSALARGADPRLPAGETRVTGIESLPLRLAIALGIGLLIGAERERRKGTGPGRAPAGIRTFALVALAGGLALAFGGELILAVS